jgi:hypothetical protein
MADEPGKASFALALRDDVSDPPPGRRDVDVTDGVVRLTGELERKSMLPAALRAVRAVDGIPRCALATEKDPGQTQRNGDRPRARRRSPRNRNPREAEAGSSCVGVLDRR